MVAPVEGHVAYPGEFPELGPEFTVLSEIGHGTFAKVYKAYHSGTKQYVALKRVRKTTAPWRTYNELGYLIQFGGKAYVSHVFTVLRHKDQITLVLPYMEHIPFYKYMGSMSLSGIASYMRALLTALAYIHKESVIHRDVKPSNFLHNPKTGQFMLIDFGLADLADASRHTHAGNEVLAKIATNVQRARKSRENAAVKEFHRNQPASLSKNSTKRKRYLAQAAQAALSTGTTSTSTATASSFSSAASANSAAALPGSSAHPPTLLGSTRLVQLRGSPVRRREAVAPRAGTRGFRAPEVLLRVTEQTTALDVWSAGVTLLCLLTRKYPIFHAPDDLSSLVEITRFFGSAEMVEAARSMGRRFSPVDMCEKQDIRAIITGCAPEFNTVELADQLDQAVELLLACLTLSSKSRVTAEAALSLPFLRDVPDPPFPPCSSESQSQSQSQSHTSP